MKKYLAIIIGVILLGLLTQVVFGELKIEITIPPTPINGTETIPYFIDQDFFMDRNQPVVCLHESPNSGYDKKVYEKMTLDAMANWTDKLYEKTKGNTQWYLHYVFVEDDGVKRLTDEFKYCDINVMFDNSTPINITTGSYIKGGTWHYKSITHWADIKVWTWDYFPIVGAYNETRDVIVPQWKAVLSPPKVSQQVLEHEFGHAFGLKHYEVDGEMKTENNYQRNWAERSIMYYATHPLYDENKQIQDMDINAIILKYGIDGWGGHTNHDVWEYIK